MNSETSKFISNAKRNRNSNRLLKLQNGKAAAAAKTTNSNDIDVETTLAEATKFARRLNIVVRNVCPECLSVIKDILLEEKEKTVATTTTNENYHVIKGGII
jgi:hypothetical protein